MPTDTAILDEDDPSGPIGELRVDVRVCFNRGWPGTTTTKDLLKYWYPRPRQRPVFRLFHTHREAVETVVYLTECGDGKNRAVQRLNALDGDWSLGLTRIVLRMATGTARHPRRTVSSLGTR